MGLNRSDLAGRQRVLGGIFLAVGMVFIVRLFSMQITTNHWRDKAARLTEEQEVLHAPRGLCLDRNGQLWVTNSPSYDLMVTPRLLGDLDTLALAGLLGMEFDALEARLAKARRYSRYKASPCFVN